MATSLSGSPGGDPNPTSPQHDLQPEPLIEPGFLIDADQIEPDSVPDGPATENNESSPIAAGKKKNSLTDAVPETPSWLPKGWKMVFKVRGSGATAGTIDRYYFEPNTERRFRSRKEVEYYLQTGIKRKKSDAAADVQPSESPASKKKKSGSGSKNGLPTLPPSLKFDFNNVPEMTSWKLKDASNDNWMPFIEDKMVSKSIKQDWDAAFQSLIK